MPDAPSSSSVVERFRAGQVPQQARLAAARGALPVSRSELLEILFLLRQDEDPEIRKALFETIGSLDPRGVAEALENPKLSPALLNFYAQACKGKGSVLSSIILNSSTHDKTLEWLAERVPPSLQDLIVLNQVRIFKNPAILEALKRNPKIMIATRRRIKEVEQLLPAQAPAAAKPSAKATPAPQAAPEAPAAEAAPPEAPEAPAPQAPAAPPPAAGDRDMDAALDALDELDDDALADAGEAMVEEALEEGAGGEEGDVRTRLARMSVPEKLEVALKGSGEERNILVRDKVKTVAEAALNSPKVMEPDIDRWTVDRSMSEDVLRAIAGNRDWTKSYAIVKNLLWNPKTPPGVAMTLIRRLSNKDIRELSRNRNVSAVLRTLAMRLYEERTKPSKIGKKKGH